MKHLSSLRKTFLIIGGLLLIIGASLGIWLLQSSQESRSRAQKATIISFTDPNASTQSITVQPGQVFTLPIFVTPGINLITTVRYVFTYNPKILTPLPSQYTYNTTIFSSDFKKANPEGPIFTATGQISGTLTIADKVDSVIKVPAQVAQFSFQVATNTSQLTSPTSISFLTDTNQTQVLSAGSTDQGSENVLSSALPVTINFVMPTPTPTNTPTPSPTPTPTPLPTPTNTPIPTPTPTATPTPPIPTSTPVPTNTPVPQATLLSLDVILHAIGSGGDNSNQNGGGGNQNPQHPQRDVTVQLFNTNNQLVAEKTGKINFVSTSGHFTGIVDLGNQIKSGNYLVKIKTPYYLTRQSKILETITAETTNSIGNFTLIAGDVDNNDQLDLLDYQALSGCYSDFLAANPQTCSPELRLGADINDDAKVNFVDINYFIRELAVQAGN